MIRRESPASKARRKRKRELFEARMCLYDCGRAAAADSNICLPCDDALCDRYFARIGEPRPSKREG